MHFKTKILTTNVQPGQNIRQKDTSICESGTQQILTKSTDTLLMGAPYVGAKIVLQSPLQSSEAVYGRLSWNLFIPVLMYASGQLTPHRKLICEPDCCQAGSYLAEAISKSWNPKQVMDSHWNTKHCLQFCARCHNSNGKMKTLQAGQLVWL